MLEPPGRTMPVGVWLAVPVLFATAVLGLVALLGVLIGAEWEATLSSALCGAAAAVTALIDVRPGTWPPAPRWALRLTYPAAVFGLGLWLGGPTVPTGTAIGVGLPALAALAHMCRPQMS